MDTLQTLNARSQSKCELCSSTEALAVYEVPPSSMSDPEHSILICSTCHEQIDHPDKVDLHHWRCLSDSMWTPIPAVQVIAWRMLTRLSSEGWPQDILDTLYLDDDTLAWAQSGIEASDIDDSVEHKDSNGALLQSGDTVVLTKDLNVKGTSFTAKRGTSVRNISLVADNPEHIEGKINGQQIVILTKFVKKSN